MSAMWLAVLGWPTVAVAQRAEGATHRIQFAPPLSLSWSIIEDGGLVSLSPWCALEAADLMPPSCSGSYSCGAISVPCIDEPTGGLNMVAAGVGLRHTGEGAINMRGAPPGSKIIASWLFWGVIARSDSISLVQQVRFNDMELIGQVFGETDEPCWDTTGFEDARFWAFWTDVTAAHDGKINGSFDVQLDGGSVNDGRRPWSDLGDPPPLLDAGPLLEGASLITIYSHPSVPAHAKVVLHESTDRMIERATYQMILPALPAATHMTFLRVGGDGQTRASGAPLAPFRTSVRFDSGPWVVIAGPGSPINAHSDWQGTDGGPINQLWDTHLTDAPAALFELEPEIQILEEARDLLLESRRARPKVLFESYEMFYESDPDYRLVNCVVPFLHGLAAF